MHTLNTLAFVLADTHGWGHMDGWGGGWMWLWGTLMMLSWVAIIAAAVWLVSRGRDGTSTGAPSALNSSHRGGARAAMTWTVRCCGR